MPHTHPQWYLGSHMCDLDCPCLKEEDDDDDFNRCPRQRKKKSHKMDPFHKKPPLPLEEKFKAHTTGV